MSRLENALACGLLVVAATAGEAQLVDPTVPRIPISAATKEPEWHGWVSAALGPGYGPFDAGLAVNASIWVTRNEFAFALRRSGISRFLDPGDIYDTSVLFGRRIPTRPEFNVVAAAGGGVMSGHDFGGAVSRGEPVVAVGAQAMVNLFVVSIGLDAFGAAGVRQRFVGVGVMVGLGGFR